MQTYGYTVSFDQFLPEVMQFTPDVPELIAVHAIKNACIEFCERSLYWQIDLPAISVTGNKGNYAIQTPVDTKLVQLINTYFDQSLLIPAAPDELANIYRMGNWQTMVGNPQYVTQVIRPEVVLVPIPYEDRADILSIRVAVAPTRDAESIDSEIYEQFAERIGYGARARLYNTPRQPYYDKTAALEMMKLFRTSISEVRIMVNKGLPRTSPQVEYQVF